MRLQRHVPSILQKTVGVRALRRSQLLGASSQLPSVASSCHYRLSSTSTDDPKRIAILGGGIAGLSSAYFLKREFPQSKITIFEARDNTGGWIKSARIDLPSDVGQEGNVLFELGPRTLRNSTPTAHMIQQLGIVDDIVYTKKSDPGAKNRFIYYPDRLNRLPSEMPSIGDAFALAWSGILNGAWGLLKEPLMPKRSDSISDETVGSFLSRRVDRRLANNIVSAVFHGIYAGDIWKLSAKTLLRLPWQLEGRYGSALGGYFNMHNNPPAETQLTLVHPYDRELAKAMNEEIDLELDFAKNLKSAAMFSFKDGLQHLVNSLQRDLEKSGNIEIKTNTEVSKYELAKNGEGMEVVSSTAKQVKRKETFDLAVSTFPQEAITPYVTVMTVNLWFSNPNLLPVEGFGYLIPQSVPFEQNPERALGVIFDSSALKGQDTAGGTKLTIMFGGHWWDGWTGFPDEDEALDMARRVLWRHLNITDQPSLFVRGLHQNCIPQYTLGYEDRLRDLAEQTTDKFKGRVRLVGSQVNGVGVNDCIAGAWSMARDLRNGGWKNRSCGLDRVMDRREWQVVPASELAYVKRE